MEFAKAQVCDVCMHSLCYVPVSLWLGPVSLWLGPVSLSVSLWLTPVSLWLGPCLPLAFTAIYLLYFVKYLVLNVGGEILV